MRQQNLWAYYATAVGRYPMTNILTIKDDQDYIVTKNDLPEGNDQEWGFERVVRIRPR